jgi:5-carboxymethyl-2-hydroxymuconate isomerase
MIGDGGEGRAFVHLSVLILAGRSPDQKDQCGKELLELLKLHYHTDLIKMNLQITVHLGEMERSDYFKFTSENV